LSTILREHTADRPTAVPRHSARRRHDAGPWSPRVIVGLLTIFGLGIRLIIVRGFWLDEATSGYDSRLSYGGMLHELLHDNHPPLTYSILWLVSHTVGSTQTDLRLPSVLFGTLTIPMLYLAGRALFHERVGVLAAAFGTVGAMAVWYSQEARMYGLFMLLATVTILAQCRILQTDKRRYWVIWTMASVAMVWNQWFATLAVGAEILFFAWIFFTDRRRKPWRRPARHLGTAVLGIVVTCAPLLPLLYTQYKNNNANGLGFSSHGSAGTAAGFTPYGIFNNLVWALFGYHSNGVVAGLVAIWPLGILGVLLVLGRSRAKSRANRQLLTLAFRPMTILFVASSQVAPSRSLFEVRYFIEAVPALYLLLAGAAWTLTPSARARRLFSAVVLIGLAVGLVMQQTDGDNPRLYGYNAAFTQISSVARPGAEILYAPAYLNVDVEYFEPHMHTAPVTTAVPDLPLRDQVFVVGSFNFTGVAQSDKQTSALVAELSRSRHLEATFQAPNVTVWEFS
jgi:uncharacterized membrane protein